MTASEILKDYIDRGLASGYTGEAVTGVLKEALDLLEKQEAGLLIELPVPIGTECYYPNGFTVVSFNFGIGADGYSIRDEVEHFGKTIFTRREEAEKRLAELRGE